eukprot:gnl/MRDRNA2_/MRDRNA2_69244_c0_seq1.p1 gnl/MRDRNA2_/MRDRNA2_69244_c0~~gnl/MRDRNA2_/MRDRNA2_69244_c0_seq1.p1  ORF type:complete len:256 (-),score=21.07 gnl/MRDRNA2_/MRDRNA2_69244_c0_seq1:108-875(-)
MTDDMKEEIVNGGAEMMTYEAIAQEHGDEFGDPESLLRAIDPTGVTGVIDALSEPSCRSRKIVDAPRITADNLAGDYPIQHIIGTTKLLIFNRHFGKYLSVQPGGNVIAKNARGSAERFEVRAGRGMNMLVKAGAECKSTDSLLGTFDIQEECARSCEARVGCQHFVYGFSGGRAAGKCYQEFTTTPSCLEGWEDDPAFHFYALKRTNTNLLQYPMRNLLRTVRNLVHTVRNLVQTVTNLVRLRCTIDTMESSCE